MKVAPPKWRVILYFGIALLIACIFLFGEPFVKGHFLSTWLRYGVEQNPGGWKEESEFNPDAKETEAAIRKVGPRAIPVLLEKLDATDVAWKRSFADWQSRIDSLPGWAKIRFRWAEEEQEQAIYGFGVLKTQAVSAIPELSHRLRTTNVASAAAFCLVKIGPASLPALRMALTNGQPQVRSAAIYALDTDPSLVKQTLAEMRLLTTDSNEWNAGGAFYFLSQHSPTNEAVAFLRAALREPRVPVVSLGLARVKQLGTNARPFIPEISNLLVHPRPAFRAQATNALKTIDLAVAFAAGINTNAPTATTNWTRGGRRGSRGR